MLIATAAAVAIWRPVELDTLLDWGRWLMGHPAAVIGVILVQAALFSFALPGSLALWVVAPFLPPLIAVPVLVTGSVLGALGAYGLSRRLGSDWRPRYGAWLIDLVARRSEFFTQCALRILPGCPHWAVSYAGGILRLPLLPFTAAAILGLTVKWTVYAMAIHGVSSAAEAEGALRLEALAPLVGLTLFLFAGGLLRHRMVARAQGAATDVAGRPSARF